MKDRETLKAILQNAQDFMNEGVPLTQLYDLFAPELAELLEAADYIEKGMRGEASVSTTEAEWAAGRKALRLALVRINSKLKDTHVYW